MQNTKKSVVGKIKNIIKSVVISKKEGSKGDALNELLKMRYGKDWEKYSCNI